MSAIVTERIKIEGALTQSVNEWRARRIFDVSGVSSELDALNQLEIPLYNSPHPLNNFMLVSSRTVDRTINAATGDGYYTVNIDYSIPVAGEHTNAELDKLQEKSIVRWQTQESSEPIDHDINGKPLLDLLRLPIDNVQRDFTSKFLTYERWEPFYDLAKANKYENTLNDSDVTIFGVVAQKKQIKCRSIQPAGDIIGHPAAVLIVYSFEIRFRLSNAGGENVDNDDPFAIRSVFKGKMCYGFFSDGPALGKIMDKEGPVQTDVLLDKNGKPYDFTLQVTDGKQIQTGDNTGKFIGVAPTITPLVNPEGVTVIDTGHSIILKYDRYYTSNFAAMGL